MFATPEDAEEAFYAAFARGDVEAMREVWLDDDSIVCIHPRADILQGRAAVHASWEQILSNPPAIRHQAESRSQGPLLAVHVGHEWVSVAPQRNIVLAVTNVFQITANGWRMLLHQGAGLDLHETQPPQTPFH